MSSTATDLPFYRRKLRTEFEARRRRNPRYSVRAFARHLDFDPTALSQLMNGNRFISVDLAQKLLSRLDWTTDDQEAFLYSLAQTRLSRGLKRKNSAFHRILDRRRPDAPKSLAADFFEAISEWHHYAILELSGTRRFRPDAQWIAGELGIHPIEAQAAFDRLIELGMLIECDGGYRKSHPRFSTANKEKTGSFLRRRQKQILEKSIQSLQEDPIAIRNHSSITFAIDPSRIEAARERIENFFWEMSEFLRPSGGGDTADLRVYEMNVSLFPLQKGKEK